MGYALQRIGRTDFDPSNPRLCPYGLLRRRGARSVRERGRRLEIGQRHLEHEPVVHLQQERRKVDAASVGVGEDTLRMLRAIDYIGDED